MNTFFSCVFMFEKPASTDDCTVLTTLGGSSQDSVTQLNGSNTVTSTTTTTQQSDENSHFRLFEQNSNEEVQVVAANGNNKNGKFQDILNKKITIIGNWKWFLTMQIDYILGVVNMIDDSSRSDDSNMEKPVTPIVPNDDSDSQASSNKR